MGNMHRASSPPSHGYIRVVHANGRVQDLLSPLAAAEVVQGQHESTRNFLVCNSRSLRVGKRPCPLHPDAQLELGHLYFVLPVRTFQSRLAWSQISSLATTAMAPPPGVVASASAAANDSSRNNVVTSPNRAARLSAAKILVRILFRRRAFPLRVAPEGGVKYASQSRGCSLQAQREPKLICDTLQVHTKCFNNICDTLQVHTKYIDQLIARSNSWRPQFRTILEESGRWSAFDSDEPLGLHCRS